MKIDGAQAISSAYVFGSAGLAFATLPFLFIVVRGLMKASDNSTRHSSIINVFFFAVVVEVVSCISFMTGILILDLTSPIGVKDYFSKIVFDLFWTSDKAAAFAKVGASASPEADGAWVILHSIQVVRDFGFMLMPILCIFVGMAYGMYQSKKDTYQSDLLTSAIWTVIGGVIAYFLFVIWAGIAQYALFMPTANIWEFVSNEWSKLLGI